MSPDDAWHCLQEKKKFLILFFAMKLTFFFSFFTIFIILSLQSDGIKLLSHLFCLERKTDVRFEYAPQR